MSQPPEACGSLGAHPVGVETCINWQTEMGSNEKTLGDIVGYLYPSATTNSPADWGLKKRTRSSESEREKVGVCGSTD
jgi:hypothetical protein